MSEHIKWLCTHLMEEVFNRGNLEVADAFIAPDFRNHEMPADAPRGPDAFTAPARWLRRAFPDLHAVLHEVVVEGDGKVGRLTLSGTHQGDYLGVPGRGRSFSVQHLHMYRVRDGKFAEHWACRDDLGQLTQRGWVLPPYAGGGGSTARGRGRRRRDARREPSGRVGPPRVWSTFR